MDTGQRLGASQGTGEFKLASSEDSTTGLLDGLVIRPKELPRTKGQFLRALRRVGKLNRSQMSQVEFAAVMATLFRNAQAEPICQERDTEAQARKRLIDVINDSSPVLTLQLNKPRNVKLKWTRR